MHIIFSLIILTATFMVSGGHRIFPPIQCLIVCQPDLCKPIPACPYGLKLGNSGGCNCCESCVIPEGGQCPYYVLVPEVSPIKTIFCEIGTYCCNGECIKDGFSCLFDSNSESTEESSTITTMHIIFSLIILTATLMVTSEHLRIPPVECLIACPPNLCKPIPACPYGLELGKKGACDCCESCIIPEGGRCPYYVLVPEVSPIETVVCEIGTFCCNGRCIKEGLACILDSETTEESSTATTVTNT
ncbi:unnamed protein product [Ceutorhynchus assimilis]|uniref:IGFBP N-terminal domain-containing protein n=1 Tax=Ceutorhynchus assimilis TaxID=467358 RepID=A0A9N9QNC0_9CUCU|nr:unnamed protein product [Ceutorhynchus assimilis]